MKYLFLILLTCSNYSFGQEPEVAVQLVEINELYRGYKNRIAVGVTNNGDGVPSISCSNCDTIYWEESNEFMIVPGKGRLAKIYVSLQYTDTVVRVKEILYRVRNLPDPTVFWGAAKSGKKGSINSRLVLVKYPPEIPLHTDFVLLKWTFTVNGESVSGVGTNERHANLGPASDLIKSISEGDKVVIDVEVRGPDGVLRELSGVYTL